MSALDDKYDIEAEVGRGPSACVFKATEKGSSRTVAIKHLTPGDERAKNFPYESEWDKITALNHPSVVRALDHIEEEGECYIISEFVKGETLEHRIHREGSIPELDCIYIFRSVAQALNNAHENGLLHLNIRPGNVFISKRENGIIGRIGDFGCWTMGIDPPPTGPKLAFYKSPEQRKGTGIMVSSDIYALGKLLYVAASGVDDGRITPTALPEQCVLQEVIYGCIRTRMEDRFQSMDDFIAAMDRIEAQHFSDADLHDPSIEVTDGAAHAEGHAGEVSATGQMRATSEVQSMVIACRSHLTNKKLQTSRKVLITARDAVDEYAEFQGVEWAAQVVLELDEVEEQLELKERELEQMVRSAEEAYAESRFEDVEMLAAAASEICKEKTGCEIIAEEARKAAVNIRTFMEDAFTSMKVNDYRRADLDCIKILEISPGHVDALQMRKTIKSLHFRKRLLGFCLKVLPIILIVGGGAGSYLFFKNQTSSAADAFKKAVRNKNLAAAEEAASTLKKRADWMVKLFGEHEDSVAFIKRRDETRSVIDSALVARDRTSDNATEAIKLSLQQANSTLNQAETEFNSCNFDAAVEAAEEAIDTYDKLFVEAMLQKAAVKLKEEKWQEAHDILEQVVTINNSAEIRRLMTKTKAKLIPELSIETYVNGRQAKGAYIFVNGAMRKDEVTPASIPLDVEKEYQIGVLLPPREGRYYLPAQKTVVFETQEARRIRFDLSLIPGPEKDKDWTIPELGLKLKPVSAGKFIMGSPTGDTSQRPEHLVEISKPVWIGQFEITRAQFLKVMGRQSVDADSVIPMNNLVRSDAEAFCLRLNRVEARKNRIPLNYEYRLPTEAEWEYCSRAGQALPSNVNDLAWHAGNSDGKLHKIGGKRPNAWGIYDMLGNVAEWCMDSFNNGAYTKRKGGAKDPVSVSDSGSFVCVRGGGYASPSRMCTPAARGKLDKTVKNSQVGFRIILAPVANKLNKD